MHLQFEKREEWIRKIKGEKLQGTAESRAPRLASTFAASFPERNKCPATHCSPIVQKEREVAVRSAKEIEVNRKDGVEDSVTSTEQELKKRKRKMEVLLVLSRPAESLQNDAGFSRKT